MQRGGLRSLVSVSCSPSAVSAPHSVLSRANLNARLRTASNRDDRLACVRLSLLSFADKSSQDYGRPSKPVLCWEKTERRSRGGWSSGFTRRRLDSASRHTLMCPRLIWLHPCAAQSHLHRASASIYFRFPSPGLSALASIARSFCGRDVKSGAQRLISTLCAGFPGRLICTERRAPLHSVPSCWGVEPSFPVTRFC
jgi:hypothetical protein